jgi:hypothetical protein
VQGPAGPSGPAGLPGPKGEPGMTPEQVAVLEQRLAALERGFLKPDDKCRPTRSGRARAARARLRGVTLRGVTLCRNG